MGVRVLTERTDHARSRDGVVSGLAGILLSLVFSFLWGVELASLVWSVYGR